MRPVRLLRFFKDKVFADAFVDAGTIRMNSQAYFKTIEDAARSDSSEGQGTLRVPGQQLTAVSIPSGKTSLTTGELECGFLQLNPIYIFCTSLPEVDVKRMSDKMGPYIVEIFEPGIFQDRLMESAVVKIPKGDMLLEPEAAPVRYDKGAVVAQRPKLGEHLNLAYTQKPASFAEECEFRFIVRIGLPATPDDPQFIDLQLANPEQFVRHYAA